MSLRTLSKHLTEAKFAHNWSDPNDSTKAAGHRQYAINRFHRAVRRAQKELIAEQLAPAADPTLPAFHGRVYHSDSVAAAVTETAERFEAARNGLRFGSH